RERRFRVHAGDTPIEWTRLRTRADYSALPRNDLSIAGVVVHQILDQRRRALVVLGSNHVMKTGDRRGQPNTTTLIEAARKGSTRGVLMVDRPGMGPVAGDLVKSMRPAPALYPPGALAQRADALLFRGESLAEDPPAPGALDPAALKELDRRALIEWGEL